VCRPGVMRYIWTVAISSLSADEIRAAAETHRELPSEYQNAVIESFLAKVDREIDARVDARLAACGHGRLRDRPRTPAFFALASMVAAIPLSAIAVSTGPHPTGFWGLLVVWVAIVAINVAYISHFRMPPNER
jgi:peptidoglycan/LPS O-acetylase OafA/YrhL